LNISSPIYKEANAYPHFNGLEILKSDELKAEKFF